MNCANHPDREQSAFCQHCGKPVCSECIRNVGSSIFCEPCLAARVGAAAPPVGFPYPGYPQPGVLPAGPPIGAGEPSPGLATLLGFIPGVGAMYNGQYAKGIVHLMVFAVLVSLTDDVNGIFGLFIAGWICYMVIEAHHTASARRDGTPLPNPFGLNDLSERLGFGKAWPGGVPNATAGSAAATTPQEPIAPHPNAPPVTPYAPHYAPPYTYPYDPPVAPISAVPPHADVNVSCGRRFPSGAIWLIVLGLIFLVDADGFFHIFHHPIFWPVLLIGFGVWIFVRKMTCTGHGMENDGSAFYQWRFARAVRSAFWVILVGVIWLLDVLGILSWSRSWPLFLIGGGVMLLFNRTGYGGYGLGGHGTGHGQPDSTPAEPPDASSEAVPSDPSHDATGSDSGNGTHNDPEGR